MWFYYQPQYHYFGKGLNISSSHQYWHYKTSPILSLYAESGLKSPSSYRDSKLVNFFTRLIFKNSHPVHDEAIGIEPLQDDMVNNSDLKLFKTKIGSLITDYQLDLTYFLPETYSSFPIRKISRLDVCCDLFVLNKNSHNARKRKFIDHIRPHSNVVHLYTDGSKSPEGVRYAYCGESVQVAKRI